MLRRTILAVVITVPAYRIFSQDLTAEDFRIGHFYLDQQIDSAIHFTGPPMAIDSIDIGFGSPFTRYSFGLLTAWVDPERAISAVDVSAEGFTTYRGVAVGDSLSLVERLYGSRRKSNRYKELNRMYDLYDKEFLGFEFLFYYEAYFQEHDVKYIAFFFENNRVVKIYLWRGLPD